MERKLEKVCVSIPGSGAEDLMETPSVAKLASRRSDQQKQGYI